MHLSSILIESSSTWPRILSSIELLLKQHFPSIQLLIYTEFFHQLSNIIVFYPSSTWSRILSSIQPPRNEEFFHQSIT